MSTAPVTAYPIDIRGPQFNHDHATRMLERFLKAGDLLRKGVDLNRPFTSARRLYAQGPNAQWQQRYSWLNSRLLAVAPQNLPAFQKELQLEELTKNDMLRLVNRIRGLWEQLENQPEVRAANGDGRVSIPRGEHSVREPSPLDKLLHQVMPWIENFDRTHPDFRLLSLPMEKLDRLGQLIQERNQPCRLLHGSLGDMLNILFNNTLPSLFDQLDNLFSPFDGIDKTDQAHTMRMMMSQFSSIVITRTE